MSATAARYELFDQRSSSWESILAKSQPKAENLLAGWTSDFESWRYEVQRFRKFETDVFLREVRPATITRMHRGLLCYLISEGEKLALLLLERDSESESNEVQKQLANLDEFIVNLRTTLETWHSLELPLTMGENPLAAFV